MLRKANIVKSIRKWDDPILKTACAPVEHEEWPEMLKLIDKMKETVLATKDGVGLAAPQVGVAKRVIVFRTSLESKNFTVMINPLLVKNGLNEVTSIEGCLSYPGYTARIKRYDTVKATWKDIYGKDQEKWLEGREAIIFAHEVEHLDGVCKVGDVWERKMGLRQDNAEPVEIDKSAFFEEPVLGPTIAEAEETATAVAE